MVRCENDMLGWRCWQVRCVMSEGAQGGVRMDGVGGELELRRKRVKGSLRR